MVAIGRALMARPKLMLFDEPSMGLAPQLVEEIFEIVKRLNEDEKVTFPTGRTEYQYGAALQSIWLYPGKRSGGDGW